MVIAKGIWTRRNGVIFGEDFVHPNAIVSGATNSLKQFKLTKEFRDLEIIPVEIIDNEKWSSPPIGMYKVNWDIVIEANMKCVGLGVIIRDEKGRVVAVLSKTLDSLQDPTFGEAIGERGAMEFAKELGFHEIFLEGDSKQVVMAISSKERNWCEYGHIMCDIIEVLKSFRP